MIRKIREDEEEWEIEEAGEVGDLKIPLKKKKKIHPYNGGVKESWAVFCELTPTIFLPYFTKISKIIQGIPPFVPRPCWIRLDTWTRSRIRFLLRTCGEDSWIRKKINSS
jgi:hypothetical protein